jgi:hypothetical protein
LKVNISYAVEFEDVPAEVGKLIDRCENNLRQLHADFDMLAMENPSRAIKDISNIRENLAHLDLRLSDCLNILSGFLAVQAKYQGTPSAAGDFNEASKENDDS